MKIAVISDIHASLQSLKACLTDIDKEKVDFIVCLGDIIGYGNNPQECLKLVRQKCQIIIKGNHEEVLCNPSFEKFVVNQALTTIQAARDVLSFEEIMFLANLPITYELEDFGLCFAHGSYLNKNAWDYLDIDDEEECGEDYIFNQVRFNKFPITFVGHTQAIVIWEY